MTDGGAALLGGLGLLERAIGYALGSLALVPPGPLSRPTPCADWTLGDLLAHLDDSLLALREAADLGHVPLTVPETAGDPVTTVRGHATGLLAAWTAAEAPGTVGVGAAVLTPELLTSAGAFEIAVHGWDVAQACGARRPLPEPLAEELLELAPLLLTPADRPGRFGPPLGVAGGASERLLAFTGRRG
ncbi:TIGR03086 family metal-binding protein [Amycolatopsis sacchari]|uniref:TIGR03086 family metal-binding protein n=1 Tax=Amycolatopsis sacchari TaxID=115433 RepID=UPI003D7252B3